MQSSVWRPGPAAQHHWCWRKPLKRLGNGRVKAYRLLKFETRRRHACTIVLEFDDGDGSGVKRTEVMRFHRAVEEQTPGDVGLSLVEGKSLLNCVQQEFVVEHFDRFHATRRSCSKCGVQRRLYDNHCSELKTTLGKVFSCRERWKACSCGADPSRYISPLKNWLTEASTGDL
jgi:hypothetical protein